jgi:hypothetical protein
MRPALSLLRFGKGIAPKGGYDGSPRRDLRTSRSLAACPVSITPRLEHWKPEFASDVFAAYARLLDTGDQRPQSRDLDFLVTALDCRHVLLFAIGGRQEGYQPSTYTTTYMQPIVFVDGMKPGHGINLLTGDLGV